MWRTTRCRSIRPPNSSSGRTSQPKSLQTLQTKIFKRRRDLLSASYFHLYFQLHWRQHGQVGRAAYIELVYTLISNI
ncbi:hypothetical protein PENTCL1PPCAC_9690 [Pristionchus entomophagus]|uniref:Uncharacterized protein n=1 Tax=Pristionchus entomophagus TaxID=358040 RepID=A0AAV5SWK0_9BILA|nr:hypothetical protein PENTCL1PPCAC_9690 [Pristionchus entomophagus]